MRAAIMSTAMRQHEMCRRLYFAVVMLFFSVLLFRGVLGVTTRAGLA